MATHSTGKLATFAIGTVLFGILHGVFVVAFFFIFFLFGVGIGDATPQHPNLLARVGGPILLVLMAPMYGLAYLDLNNLIVGYVVNSLIYGALASWIWIWYWKRTVKGSAPSGSKPLTPSDIDGDVS